MRYPAMIGNVSVFVDESSMSFGRRVDSQEYPYRDTPWTDDLGRKQRVYTLNAFILGDDIEQQREALIAELEQRGTKIIVHPRFGSVSVQIGSVTWRASSRTTREDFSIECVEPNEQSQTQTTTNTLATVSQTVDDNLASHSQHFSERFSIANAPQFVSDDAKAFINNGLDSLRNINGTLQGVIAPVSDIAFAIDEIASELDQIIKAPQSLAAALVSVVLETFSLFDTVDSAISSYENLGAIWGDVEPIPNASANSNNSFSNNNTATRQQQQTNRTAVVELFNRAALTATVLAVARQAAAVNVVDVSQSPFSSYDNAVAVRDRLLMGINEQQLDADYETYESLSQLASNFYSHINSHGLTLPRLRQLAVRNEPALVLAYRLYGDATRAEDIVERNNIRNALFINERELEVASA